MIPELRLQLEESRFSQEEQRGLIVFGEKEEHWVQMKKQGIAGWMVG